MPRKGQRMSEEQKAKISASNQGIPRTQEQKDHQSNIMKGRYIGENNPMFGADRSKENNPFFGKHHSEQSRKKMSDSHKGVPSVSGEKHYMWKGDSAGYSAKHIRMGKLKQRPEKCEICGINDPYDLHCCGKTYPTKKPELWVWICRKCHRAIDK